MLAPKLFSIVGDTVSLGAEAQVARKMENDVKVFWSFSI